MNEENEMKNTRSVLTRLVPLVAALVLAGCASVQTTEPVAAPAAPAAFKELDGRWTQARPAEAQSRGEWWKAFADPVLDELVVRADRNSTSVQLAAARLNQARALLRAADADRLPQVGVSAGASRSNNATPGVTNPSTLLSAGASVAWEADVFGRLAKASQAAALDAQASEALLQSTRLLVQADVARSYFALRALDDERALVRQTVDAYRDTLRLTERRYQAGDVAELDLARVQAEVASTQSQALALDRQRAEVEHALAVLLGELPSQFGLKALGDAEWSSVLPIVPPGVPSTVLTRRPDVAAAQSSMLAAQKRVGVAQAAWFPDLSLTANGGFASNELGDLFKWSARSWGIGALLSLPVFDGGRREAGVKGANAQWDAAAAGYREQVLVAFRDVEDQLSALRLLADQAGAQKQAVDAASRATVLSTSRYRNGYVSQLELLDARRSELANRRQALQVRAAQYQATVGLIRALGGSWG
jgi:multidrug efflux system outer membrane protein